MPKAAVEKTTAKFYLIDKIDLALMLFLQLFLFRTG
jgi:hypothetical protein